MHWLIILILIMMQNGVTQNLQSCTSVESKYRLKCSSDGTTDSTESYQFSRLYFRCVEICNLEWNCQNVFVSLENERCEIYATNAQSCTEVAANKIGLWKLYTKILTVAQCSDPCQDLPCMNGGTCVAVTPDTYSCICTIWKSGLHCEIDVIGVELVCDWHHGQIFADGVQVSIDPGYNYPYFHRVKIPATTDVLAIFCEDTGPNDQLTFAAVVVSTGHVSGGGFWSCTSLYESGWSDVDHPDSHWQAPSSHTVNSGFWSVSDFQYNTVAADPMWITLSTQELYCRYDRRP